LLNALDVMSQADRAQFGFQCIGQFAAFGENSQPTVFGSRRCAVRRKPDAMIVISGGGRHYVFFDFNASVGQAS